MDFTISSKGSGHIMGSYAGATPVEALAAMHQDAGYGCSVVDGVIVPADAEDAEFISQVDAWVIESTEDVIARVAAGVVRDCIEYDEQGTAKLDCGPDAIDRANAPGTFSDECSKAAEAAGISGWRESVIREALRGVRHWQREQEAEAEQSA